MGQALQWRYPQVPPQPDARSARRPYTWRWYLALMWHEETGTALWRPTRHGQVELRPLRRLTLFEGETAASRRHTVGVDWWGRVWDNDPARQPPPPTPGPRRHGLRWPTRCTPSSPWSPPSGGPPCQSRGRSTPPRWPDVLRRVDSGLHRDLLHEVGKEACRLAGGWEQGHPPRTPPPPPPCRLPKAGRHLPLRRPLHHPAPPLYAGVHRRPPDHGAANPGAEINLQACFAAPLAPPFAPSDHW